MNEFSASKFSGSALSMRDFFRTLVALGLVLPTLGAATEKKTTAARSILNDSWYVMTAGKTPYGHFHEVIERRDGKLSYRYKLTKVENSRLYEENIGALAQEDLTPVAFNLNKAGSGALESINATYTADKFGGIFKVSVSGAKSASFKRACPKGTILDVFFPVWVSRNWDLMKPGYRGWVQTFAEDPEKFDFRARTARFQVKEWNPDLKCLSLKIEMESVKGDWCLTKDGVLVELVVGAFQVRRVSGEDQAKRFLAPVLPKN